MPSMLPTTGCERNFTAQAESFLKTPLFFILSCCTVAFLYTLELSFRRISDLAEPSFCCLSSSFRMAYFEGWLKSAVDGNWLP